MSYYSDLDGKGRIKFELINRLLNTVRKASGKPLVIFYEIEEKSSLWNGNSSESNI